MLHTSLKVNATRVAKKWCVRNSEKHKRPVKDASRAYEEGLLTPLLVLLGLTAGDADSEVAPRLGRPGPLFTAGESPAISLTVSVTALGVLTAFGVSCSTMLPWSGNCVLPRDSLWQSFLLACRQVLQLGHTLVSHSNASLLQQSCRLRCNVPGSHSNVSRGMLLLRSADLWLPNLGCAGPVPFQEWEKRESLLCWECSRLPDHGAQARISRAF